MHTSSLPGEFATLSGIYPDIFVVESPPRCNSTAFARVFWEQPTIRYYAHEPFEITYYQGRDLSEVVEKLKNPLDLTGIRRGAATAARSLVIKEMPYQVGENFPILAALATRPIVFLMRDPRLNVASRIEKKIEGGDSPEFPLVETGWELLRSHVDFCRDHDLGHVIIETTDFRNRPAEVFGRLFEIFGLPFSPATLRWNSRSDIDIDNLGGSHRHLYRHALESSGVEPAIKPIPNIQSFTENGGLRRHVEYCRRIYEDLAHRPERISGDEDGRRSELRLAR